MRRLVAIDTSCGAGIVDLLLRIWDAGDAVLPVDHRLPRPAVKRLLASLRPAVYRDAEGDQHKLSDEVEVLEGDALVIATSGSTGEPKGVIHTHASVAASARATNAGIGTDPARDRWLCCLPLSHVAGLSVVTRALLAGTSLQVLGAFDADAVTAAALSGATLTTLVPTALSRIDARMFRRIVIGGTHPPERLPPNCLVSYGMTETGSAVAYDGRDLPGAELRIVDDAGNDARTGEIWVRGDMVMRAYRTDEPEGRDPKRADGWFPTADIGSRDASGALEVHGRQGDMIISGGENVWPVAVERVLIAMPNIDDVCVIGREDPEWGERVVAVVVPHDHDEPPSLAAIRDQCKAQLPGFAAPRSVELVETLPRTPLGKVDRKSL